MTNPDWWRWAEVRDQANGSSLPLGGGGLGWGGQVGRLPFADAANGCFWSDPHPDPPPQAGEGTLPSLVTDFRRRPPSRVTLMA